MITAQTMAMKFRQRDERMAATPEQLQARLGLRSSNAAAPHRNRKREETRPGKGNRNAWKREV